MQKIILLFSTVLLFSSCTDAQVKESSSKQVETSKKAQPTGISKVVGAAEFKQLMKRSDAQLIDVRTPAEYNAGKIGAAKNIDYYSPSFKSEMAKLDKSKPILVYCAVGGRSGQAASVLKDMGFKEIYDLKGGYNGWPEK